MRHKLMWSLTLSAAVLMAAYGANVVATSQSGFSATTIASGRFGDIDVTSQVLREFGDPDTAEGFVAFAPEDEGPVRSVRAE